MTRSNGFQAKVLTHLEYIKEKQDEHDKLFGKVFDRFDTVDYASSKRRLTCDKRFDVIEKEQSKIKGIYLGAAAVIGAIGTWIGRFLK